MKPLPRENPFSDGNRLNKGINHKGHEGTQRFLRSFLCVPLCPLWLKVLRYFFSLMSTDAWLFSQLMLSVQVLPF